MTEPEPAPPAPTPAEDQISIRVMGQDGSEVFFKLKKTTPLQKMFTAYAERLAQPPGTLRFLYDGNRLRGEQTPKELDMEDGDMVDAVLQQTGGK
jgi:small ubiquitin-related modifier